jgi:UDP-N-acetylmuramate dehydrogenase
MNIQRNVSLKDKNTFRIGGIAEFYIEPGNEQDIVDAISWANENQKDVFVLGRGSNVLVSDRGWNGIVLNLAEGFTNIKWNENLVYAQGGVSLNTIVCQAIDRSLAGAEELSGIPGTMGGAVIMNAGAFDTSISNFVREVRYFDHSRGTVHVFTAKEMEFGYRKSVLQSQNVTILSVRLQFDKSQSSESLSRKRMEILSRRKAKQPLEYPNCGSVFKRPEGKFAGSLIEQCGLKGTQIGGVEISRKHANFIINKSNGSASDVRKLIHIAQKAVYEKFGVLLEPEVIFIGEHDEPLFEAKVN